MHLLEEAVRGALLPIYAGPLVNPAGESLVLPQEEGFLVDDGRLNDLTVREDAPCDGVHVLVVAFHRLVRITLGVHCLVAHSFKLVQMSDERLH